MAEMRKGPAEIRVASCGLIVSVQADEAPTIDVIADTLPPGWRRVTSKSDAPDRRYRIGRRCVGSDVVYDLDVDDAALACGADQQELLDLFESDVDFYLATHSRDRVFVHAGVVGYRGAAIVIPGVSHSGKSTLVAALLRTKMVDFYSDEFAVIGGCGRVFPYPRPLAIREDGGTRRRIAPTSVGLEPIPVGCIILTEYSAEPHGPPRALRLGEAVLGLMANTVSARLNPKLALACLSRAATDAVAFEGKRGEADDVSFPLLDLVPSQIGGHRYYDAISAT